MAVNLSDFGVTQSVTGDLSNDTAKYLYNTIFGWQYLGVGQAGNQDARSFGPYDVSFVLDQNVSLDAGVVPYNSSIWWNNENITLDAPFLEIGADCSWFDDSFGICLCIGDQPITTDFRGPDNIRCVSQSTYIWGFSSAVSITGLILEMVWLAGCWVMWLYARSHSKLVSSNRTCSGDVRAILDIAEAINRELGDCTGSYVDSELIEELEKRPPVGYTIETSSGMERIALMPVPKHDGARRRRLDINRDTVYS